MRYRSCACSNVLLNDVQQFGNCGLLNTVFVRPNLHPFLQGHCRQPGLPSSNLLLALLLGFALNFLPFALRFKFLLD